MKGFSVAAVIYTIISVALVAGGGYLIISHLPSTALPFSTFSVEERDGYVAYEPRSYKNSETKKMVLILPPSDTASDWMKPWQAQADKHGFMLAGITDWTAEGLQTFVRGGKEKAQVAKMYMSGFSHGGYISCEFGLKNQDVVDGIIPMGAFCSDGDLAGSVQRIPILTIIGDQDTWALGDDGDNLSTFGRTINTELVMVPGIGHQFPDQIMARVGDWVAAH
ncbi:MAG: hypothetical protein A2898_03915 [Candidatus Kerfeldbacteria bacterium RIFCSPLOWO2_01_FULL_48_11]|uniref:Phospholipase/carboxylesterase/thioesterase domain-containing protein n=1 Tax=Candidatus Kerfeldbacteria bacterium RIFCSPLOWO2_01_FULL_48_11 TaxID=1798543 RepID=A0A1G2B6K8_9BACT|nr:MAG: hypothetical protein UY34_C0004G0040 [Parcubacteria group bacterium GW2011_GWA2_48_9]KKW14585.1 MAG: hypothetical protein UY52_C0024G0018 [Parcubacteria group bacterium GW2011_GWC2_49_9]OGY84833.1 MAG: hypothetical protein A2898_03915 [Candidatus Kerfeldbacteria bacterium RIFCSPLOWO2_01_FULL_48_11]